MTTTVERRNHLGDNFYTMPRFAYTTMTKRQVQETLLYTEGRVMACGEMWDVVSRHLGAGMYRVSLRKWEPSS